MEHLEEGSDGRLLIRWTNPVDLELSDGQWRSESTANGDDQWRRRPMETLHFKRVGPASTCRQAAMKLILLPSYDDKPPCQWTPLRRRRSLQSYNQGNIQVGNPGATALLGVSSLRLKGRPLLPSCVWKRLQRKPCPNSNLSFYLTINRGPGSDVDSVSESSEKISRPWWTWFLISRPKFQALST